MKNRISSCCAGSRMDVTTKKPLDLSKQTIHTSNHIIFREKMIQLPGGEFLMGTNEKDGFPADGEGPIRQVKIDPFLIDQTAVTNAEFKHFIEDTGYVTDAEQYGWSFVFDLFVSKNTWNEVKSRVKAAPWWLVVHGATWDHPEGKDSHIHNRMQHPVTHISWNDAVTFCEWSGKRLPTEAEWEFAARGGLEQKKYPWGDNLHPKGMHYCNIWQGKFPEMNDKKDGYAGTAPVNTFPANGYGLYNMSGNVWEWCADWFTKRIHKTGGKHNPHGPKTGETRVMRGGSYLCHYSYCNRYRVAARTSNTPDSSTGNIGLRCAASI